MSSKIVFCDMMLYSLVNRSKRFGQSCCHCLQDLVFQALVGLLNPVDGGNC